MTEQQQLSRNCHKHQRIVHSSKYDPSSPNLLQYIETDPRVADNKTIPREQREDRCSCYADREKAEKRNDQWLAEEDSADTEEE